MPFLLVEKWCGIARVPKEDNWVRNDLLAVHVSLKMSDAME